MSNIVSLKDVSLRYPIYSTKAQSLRNSLVNMAVGGKLLRDGKDVVHVQALTNINFNLEEGDRLAIMGHNGAGKTTLLKVIAGVYEPDNGDVIVNGRISSMVNINLGLDTNLTGAENIIHLARKRGHNIKIINENMNEIAEFSELGNYIDLPVKTYSAGMVARLVFAVATWFDPDVLLLDEWIGAGDAGFFHKAESRMTDMLSKSRVIILATHSHALAKRVCNKLLVLNNSEQIYFGPISNWDFANSKPLEIA